MKARTLAALAAPVLALAGFSSVAVAPQAEAAADEALTVELVDVQNAGTEDPDMLYPVATVKVCLVDLPTGDRDGVVTVTQNDWTLQQSAPEH